MCTLNRWRTYTVVPPHELSLHHPTVEDTDTLYLTGKNTANSTQQWQQKEEHFVREEFIVTLIKYLCHSDKLCQSNKYSCKSADIACTILQCAKVDCCIAMEIQIEFYIQSKTSTPLYRLLCLSQTIAHKISLYLYSNSLNRPPP